MPDVFDRAVLAALTSKHSEAALGCVLIIYTRMHMCMYVRALVVLVGSLGWCCLDCLGGYVYKYVCWTCGSVDLIPNPEPPYPTTPTRTPTQERDEGGAGEAPAPLPQPPLHPRPAARGGAIRLGEQGNMGLYINMVVVSMW